MCLFGTAPWGRFIFCCYLCCRPVAVSILPLAVESQLYSIYDAVVHASDLQPQVKELRTCWLWGGKGGGSTQFLSIFVLWPLTTNMSV